MIIYDMMRAIIQFTIILLVGATIVLSTSWLVNRIKKPDVVEKIVEKQVFVSAPTCNNDYAEFQDLVKIGQSVRLISNIGMYAQSGRLINTREIVVNRSGAGQIACGYLYVKVRKDGMSLEEKYDSVYINPQDFGGHILSNKGGIAIPNPESKKTEFLLPLNSIAYIPRVPFNPNAQNFRVADWTKMINISNQTKFSIGLSTIHPEGMIEDITIAYKCWDSATGKEMHGCQLSL